MKNMTIMMRNFIIFIGAVVATITIIFIFADMAFPATITWADPNQAEVTATERSVKYSYDSLNKIEDITSVVELKAEIVRIDQDIKNIKEGAASQILGLQAQRQRRVDMLKQIKSALSIVDVITP